MDLIIFALMIDCHVHIGLRHASYYPPGLTAALMHTLGARCYIVSSESADIAPPDFLVREMTAMTDASPGRALPALNLTPHLVGNGTRHLLASPLKWHAILINPTDSDICLTPALDIATRLGIPLIIHSDHTPPPPAQLTTGILATASPHPTLLSVPLPEPELTASLHTYHRVMADTTFLSLDTTLRLAALGFHRRLVWGTDSCHFPHGYQDLDLADHIEDSLSFLAERLDSTTYADITHNNARHLFNC